MFQGRFGKGYIGDHTREGYDKSADLTTRHLFGGSSGVPAEFSLEGFIRAIFDQGQTSSCVGWALAQAIYLRCLIMGVPIDFPSALAIYTFARAMSRYDIDVPLVDGGCVPSFAVEGLGKWGVPSASVWPFVAENVNAAPDLEDLMWASAFKVLGFYRIASSGQQRLDDVRQAISHGYPVCIGAQIDQAFEDAGPKTVLTAPDPSKLLGGHMTNLISYTADGRFRDLNQWGSSWANGGLVWVDEEFVASDLLTDAFALTLAPTGLSGTTRKAA